MKALSNAVRLMRQADQRHAPGAPAAKAAPTTAQLLPAWKSGQPQAPTWDITRAIKEGFKSSPWVHIAVSKRSQACASLPWRAYTRRSGKDEWQADPGHPLETLLEFPNAYMSRQDLIERVIEHLDLGGNALLTKVVVSSLRGGKVPVELWPIDPSGLKPIPSRAEFISGYEYQKDGERVVIPAADVIHFSYSDPGNPLWGMSPLQAAASAVDTDVAAARWNRIGFQNRAIPEILFTLDEPLSRDDWEKARDELNKAYAGSENGRQPWVVGAGAKVEMLSWKPTDMDFIEGRKLTREEILAAYQVPPPIAGIYADATLANLDASRKVFWSDTIVPLMDNLEAAINRALVPFFGTRETLKVCYDTSDVEVLRANVDLKSQTYERLVKNGVPPNQAVEMLDMELAPIEGGDVGYIPATMIPLPLAADLAHESLRMREGDRTNPEDLAA